MNKKVIDLKGARYTAIDKDHVVCKIRGMKEEPYSEMKALHAKYDLGEKKVWYSPNIILEQEDARTFAKDEEVTLMNWGNAYIRDIQYEKTSDKADIADGVNALGNVASVELELHLDGDFKATKKKITWLSTDQDLVPVELEDFDHLLAKDKLTEEEETHWEDFLTPKSEFKSYAVADCNVWDVKVDDFIQFDRKGYFRCDKAPTKGSPGVFFKVPSGKE